MKKKYLAFCLAVVLLCNLCLTACGDQGYVEDETKAKSQDAADNTSTVSTETTSQMRPSGLIPLNPTKDPDATEGDGKKKPTLELVPIEKPETSTPGTTQPSTTKPGNTESTTPEESEKVFTHQIYLEEYMEIYVLGSDGFGYIYPKMDFEKLKEECAKYLIEDPEELSFIWTDCETSQDYLDEMFKNFDLDDLDAKMMVGDKLIADATDSDMADIDALTSLSNGDKITLIINPPDDRLDDLLTAKLEASTIEFTVEGLKPFESIDPFAFPRFYWYEMTVVNGEVGYRMSPYGAESMIQLPNGNINELNLMIDIEEEQLVMPDDMIRLYIESDTVEGYRSRYGENIFTRTEAYVRAGDVLAYLPSGNQVNDVFSHLSEVGIDNAKYAMKRLADSCTETETTVECVGMMFYYSDMGNVAKNWDTTEYHNRLVFVFKITNAEKPEGWYSYLAYNGDVCFVAELNRSAKTMETYTVGFHKYHMEDDYRYYQNEHPQMAYYGYESNFEHNGVTYPGHTNLADVFAAIKATMPYVNEYDHLIVTESLQSHVETY